MTPELPIGLSSGNLLLREIKNYPILAPDELEALAKIKDRGLAAASLLDTSIHEPDMLIDVELGRQAEEKIVLANMGLVTSTANRYQGLGLDFEDLFQEGCFGLMHAARNYDWKKGVQFSTYAVPCIEGEILKAIADTSNPIRIPRNYGAVATKLRRIKRELKAELGTEPSLDEIYSTYTSTSYDDYLDGKVEENPQETSKTTAENILRATNPQSWELLTEEEIADWEDSGSFAQRMADTAQIATALDYTFKPGRNCFTGEKTLRNREICVMSLNGFSNKEISEELGITRERVRQILKKYLPILGDSLQDSPLPTP